VVVKGNWTTFAKVFKLLEQGDIKCGYRRLSRIANTKQTPAAPIGALFLNLRKRAQRIVEVDPKALLDNQVFSQSKYSGSATVIVIEPRRKGSSHAFDSY
jgi:hypothetical protein